MAIYSNALYTTFVMETNSMNSDQIAPKDAVYCKSGNFLDNFIFANSVKRYL